MIPYLFAGSDTTAAQVLEVLCDTHKPQLVITREDAPYGRKKELKQTQVAVIAQERGIEILKTNRPESVLSDIEKANVSRGLIVSYGAILEDRVLETLDWFNLHFSLLPQLRGAAPVQRALMQGISPTGVSLFKIDSGMDTGPIYKRLEVDIDGLTTQDALQKMAEASMPLLFDLLGNPAPALREQTGPASYAPKLRREECELIFEKPADELLRIIRASYPEPVAWTLFRGQPLRVTSAAFSGLRVPDDDKVIGEVEKVAGRVYVVCGGQTRLELLEVQPFSKKQMAAVDWFNGVGKATLGN